MVSKARTEIILAEIVLNDTPCTNSALVPLQSKHLLKANYTLFVETVDGFTKFPAQFHF